MGGERKNHGISFMRKHALTMIPFFILQQQEIFRVFHVTLPASSRKFLIFPRETASQHLTGMPSFTTFLTLGIFALRIKKED
jgi:hypothetical protein